MNGRYRKILNRKEISFCVVLFVAFAIIAYLFPYSGDDWAWGSQIGIDRLEAGFEGYNGRYLGNLLVIALTRSRLLQVITVAASMLCACILPAIYCKNFSMVLLSFSAFIIFLLPKQIFVQSVAWTAGFSNYVPPILLVLIYLIIIKNIFDENPVYKKYVFILTFVLGVACTLFMENVTVYAVFISLAIALFARIKHKKFFAAHISNFAGCAAGAVIMFSNSVYLKILNNADGYRSTAAGSGFLSTVKGHLEIICNQFFINNIPFLAVISALCVTLSALYLKKSDGRLKKAAGAAVFINAMTLTILLAKKSFSYWIIAAGEEESGKITFFFLFSTVCLYCLSVLVITAVCITDKNLKFKALLALISAPAVTAPLILVNPIGPRCFMPVYLLTAVFAVCSFEYIRQKINFAESVENILSLSASAVCLAMFIFTFSIYSTVHSYSEKRDEYVKKQVEAGSEVITVCKLPYSSYVWTGDPDLSPWNERYRLFYGIDKNTKFVFLSYKEFDKWAQDFDRQNNFL